MAQVALVTAIAAASAGVTRDAAGQAPAPVSATETAQDLEAEALDLEDRGELREAAKRWQALAVTAEDAEVRMMAAFRAQRARRALGASTGALAEFCAAARIIAWALAREDLPAEARADFEGFAREVETEIAIATRADRRGCSSQDGDTSPQPEAAREAEERAVEGAPTSSAAPRTSRPARPFLLAGAVTTSVGLALAGLMSYGLAVDHAAAEVVYELAAKNRESGLTIAEAAELDEALARGRAGARLALGSGIAAGVVGLVGVGLLAHGGRLARAERLAVTPRIGGEMVGISLGGRF